MKDTIAYLKKLYRNQNLEFQYLLLYSNNGNINAINISAHNTPNSSITDFSSLDSLISQLDKEVYKVSVVHNHPGGNNPIPSNMDFKNADLISMYLKYLGFELNDYLIYSKKGYYSFREANYLKDYSCLSTLNLLHEQVTHIPELFSDEMFNLINKNLEEANVFCISSRNFNNYFVSPLELSLPREQNIYVESITFVKEGFVNAKTLSFLKSLFASELIFEVDGGYNVKLIV